MRSLCPTLSARAALILFLLVFLLDFCFVFVFLYPISVRARKKGRLGKCFIVSADSPGNWTYCDWFCCCCCCCYCDWFCCCYCDCCCCCGGGCYCDWFCCCFICFQAPGGQTASDGVSLLLVCLGSVRLAWWSREPEANKLWRPGLSPDMAQTDVEGITERDGDHYLGKGEEELAKIDST